MLVSKERLVGSSGGMVLENVEDQLIDDPELNLVLAHEPDVVRGSAVEANNGSINGCTEWSIKRHVVGSIEPLGETLAVSVDTRVQCVSRSTRVVKLTFITCSPPEREGVLVEEVISVDGNRHERAPAIVLALVLEELQKRRGRGHQDVEANEVA